MIITGHNWQYVAVLAFYYCNHCGIIVSEKWLNEIGATQKNLVEKLDFYADWKRELITLNMD